MSETNGHTIDGRLTQLREQRRGLRKELRVKKLAREVQVLEAAVIPDWVSAYVDLLDRYRDGYQFSTLLAPIASTADRRFGRDFPIFQSEQELSLLRAPARILCSTNSYGIGILNGLTSYVIGSGYTYRAMAIDDRATGKEGRTDSPGKSLVDRVQDELDWFTDPLNRHVRWPWREPELLGRKRRDGEYFLRHGFDEHHGRAWVRHLEPEQIMKPPGTTDDEWSFGIRTDPEDVEDIQEYHAVYMSNPADGEDIPANEIVHAKNAVDMSIKRGLTDFCFDTSEALETSAKLRRNAGQGASVQAAFAGVREHETSTKQEATDFQQSMVTGSVPSPLTGQQTDVQRVYPGMMVDMPEGVKFVAPPMAANAEAYVAILQACLRGASTRWNAPEWLGSADASNNSFASALTAESPWVLFVIREQNYLKTCFLETMLWVVRCGIRAGRLPPDTLRKVKIIAEAPSPVARNTLQEAQKNQLLVTAGAMSVQQWCQEDGRDYEETVQQIEEHSERVGKEGEGLELPEGGTMPGQGGQQEEGEVEPAKGTLPDGTQAAQASSEAAGKLRGTVGGLNAVSQLQQQYYSGAVPRDAAIANVMVLLGLSQQEAESLFPEKAPDAPKPEGAEGMQGAAGAPQQGAPAEAPPGGEQEEPAPSDDIMDLLGDQGDAAGATEPGATHPFEGRQATGRRDAVRLLETRLTASYGPQAAAMIAATSRHLLEGCVPNKSGKGHHDSETGHPCSANGETTAPQKPAVSKPVPGKAATSKPSKPASTAHPGSEHGSVVRVKPVKQRAFTGEPATLKTSITKQETGRIGEAVILAYLKHQGHDDARPMNTGATNFPVDMIEDHAPTEVKAGLASNSRKAQQWRLTFSKESATEKSLYENMTPKERTAWNAEKQKRIHNRKMKVIKQLQKANPGKKIKPRTMTVIINPDTKTADVYEFDGLHDRIDWQSAQGKAGYKGSVKYDHG